MWPPNSFGLVDRCALFDIRYQDRRELSGLAHCVPPAVGRLAQMPVPVCLFRRKDRSCAHSFRTEHQAGRSFSGRLDPFAAPFGYDRYLREADVWGWTADGQILASLYATSMACATPAIVAFACNVVCSCQDAADKSDSREASVSA